MLKKLALSLITIYAAIGVSSSKYDKFSYEYQITASDNSALGIIDLYNAKQHLIDTYNQEILFKDPTLHQHLIIENIEDFAYEDSLAKYSDGKIIIIIGEGKGQTINGKLRTSYCDTSTTNNRIYIIEWLNGLWK